MLTPHGLDEILATFGDCHSPGFEAANIVSFTLPYPLLYGTTLSLTRTRCHKLLVPVFQAVLQAIKDGGLAADAAHFGGIFSQRPIRGFPNFPSTHSWGIAIDLNPATNGLGHASTQNPAVVELFKNHGFAWGGEFKSRLDPMHFQYATNY